MSTHKLLVIVFSILTAVIGLAFWVIGGGPTRYGEGGSMDSSNGWGAMPPAAALVAASAPDGPAACTPAARPPIEPDAGPDLLIARLGQQIIRSPNSPARYVDRARAYFLTRQFDKAQADLDKAISLDRNCAAAYEVRGELFARKRNEQAALDDFDRAVRLDDKLAGALAGRGAIRLRRGDLDGAMADLDKALAIEPSLSDARVARAGVLIQRGLYDQALADCQTALDARPNDVATYLARAAVYAAQKHPDKALADLNAAVSTDPNNAKAYLARGMLLADQEGRQKQAIVDLTRAIDLGCSDPDAYAARGRCWLAVGEGEHALPDFGKLIEMAPDSPDGYLGRAEAQIAAGNFDLAVADLAQAGQLDPSADAPARLTAKAYSGKEDFDKAAAAYRDYLRRKPDDVPATLALIEVLMCGRHFDQARQLAEETSSRGRFPTAGHQAILAYLKVCAQGLGGDELHNYREELRKMLPGEDARLPAWNYSRVGKIYASFSAEQLRAHSGVRRSKRIHEMMVGAAKKGVLAKGAGINR